MQNKTRFKKMESPKIVVPNKSFPKCQKIPSGCTFVFLYNYLIEYLKKYEYFIFFTSEVVERTPQQKVEPDRVEQTKKKRLTRG